MFNFIGHEAPPSTPEEALFHIIPFPFEDTVSFGGGTGKGPNAILKASQQLMAFDGISTAAVDAGIFTAPASECYERTEMVLESITRRVRKTVSKDKIPVVLGGEHTITQGCVQAFIDEAIDIGVIHFDAHADLRFSYDGTPYSKACVMRRIFEKKIPFYQIGSRAVSLEEHEFRLEHKIPYLSAIDIYGQQKKEFQIPDSIPEKVYVTIDIDVLDPSIVSATGSPVPGGLLWYDMLAFLQKIVDERTVVGFDCVELAPLENDRKSDFAATQLIYSFMGMIARDRM